MAPRRKCPVNKPVELRSRTFRHRQNLVRAREVLESNLARFFELFVLILNQADATYDDAEFDGVIDLLQRLVNIWSNSLVFRRYHPYRR